MTWTAEGMPYYYNVFTQGWSGGEERGPLVKFSIRTQTFLTPFSRSFPSVSSWEQPPSYAAGYAAAMSAAPYSAEGAGGTADAASAPEAAEGTEGQEAQGNAEAGSDDDSSDSDSKGDNDEDAIPLPEDEQEDTKPAAAGAAGAAAPPVPPQPATAPKKEKEEKAENKDDGGDKSPKGNERKQVYAPSSMIGLPTGNPLGWTVVAPKTEVVKPAAKPEVGRKVLCASLT